MTECIKWNNDFGEINKLTEYDPQVKGTGKSFSSTKFDLRSIGFPTVISYNLSSIVQLTQSIIVGFSSISFVFNFTPKRVESVSLLIALILNYFKQVSRQQQH